MKRVGFYAPMKAPTHPTPSGDRALARSLMQALDAAGYAPDLASDLRLHEKHGSREHQDVLLDRAAQALPEIVDMGRARGWCAWVTYHNYYKAPDLLGPAAAAELSIPYLQIESTRARKRLNGPWALFAEHAERAADAADVILYFTHRDREALEAYGPKAQHRIHLRPFLPRSELPPASARTGPILAAAMMRAGDKIASYHLIAETLALLDGDWHLSIAGDGPCRADVAEMMAPFGQHVSFLGELDYAGMQEVYADASILFWPGVNEAIGMTYLEAQAAGIPVLAQDRPGLREVLPPGLNAPTPEHGAQGLATTLRGLIDTPPDAAELRAHMAEHHLLPAAAQTLAQAIEKVL